MPIVVGISLRTAGKIYHFDPGTEEYRRGERVLVETARGPELGTVKVPACEVDVEQIIAPLKPVVRRATAADISREQLNREREDRAVTVCKRLVEKLNLQMHLIDAQFTLDGAHVLIHFLSESRVDFRELVRELARELRARIELRQVGVRDKAKFLGGYGICGRKMCCSSFLTDFAPVAISMAKDQGLALNPQKISGNCGRLMCCLAFECDQYRTERADLPRVNAMIQTPEGLGKVIKLNVMTRQIEVMIPNTPAPIWFSADMLAGKAPAEVATPCCAGAGHAASGGCGRCHEQTDDVDTFGMPEMHETVSKPDRFAYASVAAPTPEPALTGNAAGPAKPRRRRKKPLDHGRPAGNEPARAVQADSTVVAAEKPKRPRRRKPRPAGTAAAGEQTAAPMVAVKPAATGTETSAAPSGRYRPRRRRRPSANGGQAT
ncbi:MAG TPA: regulatory iron-sulfur-containing complex subunit RicT [Armatimonadota bacterium]|jgi:cell fate regulator YaaT (PSP1 superfamily)